jgi:hypothetical protein
MNPAERAIYDLTQAARAREAEQVAEGWRFLSIVHGDLERQEDVDALSQLAETFWGQVTDGRRQIRGGNDYTTYCAGPPADQADRVITAVEAVASEFNPGWWRVTRTYVPDFGRSGP